MVPKLFETIEEAAQQITFFAVAFFLAAAETINRTLTPDLAQALRSGLNCSPHDRYTTRSS